MIKRGEKKNRFGSDIHDLLDDAAGGRVILVRGDTFFFFFYKPKSQNDIAIVTLMKQLKTAIHNVIIK